MSAVLAEARTPTVRTVVRRVRFWIVVLLIVAVVAIGGLVLRGLGAAKDRFAPDNPGPQGGQALAQVLRQQGVVVDDTRVLDDARAATGTLLVDDRSGLLTAAEWADLDGSADRIVVVDPGYTALTALVPDVRLAGYPDGTTARPGCGSALARRAGSMDLTDVTRSLRSTSGTVCFRTGGDDGGQLVVTRTDGGTQVLLLADATAYDDAHIGSAGNAAVALGALGASGRLTWYRPSPLDLGSASAPTLQELTPPWVTPAILLLFVTVIAAALWRGRRFGPVVIEPLPVVVRSRETVEGRARLYARSGARLRAADALRMGAVGRIAPMLGLGRAATVDQVAEAAARVTGRNAGALRDLLVRTLPGHDGDLMRISDDLAALEAAVRSATVPGAPPPPTNGAR